MTTHNPQPQPQPMEQPQVEPQPMEQPQDEPQPMEQNTEMEQGGQVEEQYQEDPDKIVLNWGEVFTFFK
tara:strand:- start:5817 stop:6023 length:207 start_codon:yes stop_codon:yes gene_type:complete